MTSQRLYGRNMTIPQCTSGRKRKEPPRFIVLHHTAGEGLTAGVVRTLNSRGLSYHDIVEGGKVFNVYPYERVAFHAGYANEGSIGVSVISRGVAPSLSRKLRNEYTATAQGKQIRFLEFTPEEIDAVDNHCRELSLQFGIPLVFPDIPFGLYFRDQKSLLSLHGVIGHAHVSPHKVDPSPMLIEELKKRWK